MGYKSFCCLLLLLTGNVSLRAQGIDDISPMAIYNIGLVGCDSIGVNVLKTFIDAWPYSTKRLLWQRARKEKLHRFKIRLLCYIMIIAKC